MIKWVLISFLAVLSSTALADEPPSKINYQLVSGNCNLVINSQSGEAQKAYPQRICSGLSASKSMADSLVKIERFIEASNPTEVTISDAALVHWAGDAEEFLTLSLFNSSGLPAEKVKVTMLDVVRPNEEKSRPLSFYPSKAFPKSLLANLSISKNRTTQIPIASASEIESVSKHRVPPSYEFMGAGLSPNMPDTVKMRYAERKGITKNPGFESEAIGLGVELSYKNIFGANNTTLTGIYLYYGKFSGS